MVTVSFDQHPKPMTQTVTTEQPGLRERKKQRTRQQISTCRWIRV
jgi:hypothetical protein